MEPFQVLQTVAFLDLLASGLIVYQIPPHAKSLGCSPISIGLMLALYAGCQLISGVIFDTLAGIKSKIKLLIIIISLCGTSYVLLGMTSSIVFFIGLRAFLGFFKHTQMLTKSLTASVEKDKDHLRSQSKNMEQTSALGLTTGAILGGFIVEIFPSAGFTLIAILVGIIYAVNSYFIRNLPITEESKQKETQEEPAPIKVIDSISEGLKSSIKQFYKIDWNIYGEFFLLRILMTLCMGVYFCNFALYLRVKHQVSPGNLGFIIALVGAIGHFFHYFKEKIDDFYTDDKDFRQRNYHSFLSITLLLIFMAIAPSSSLYVFLLIPLMVSFNIGRSVTFDLIVNKAKDLSKSSDNDKDDQKITIIGISNTLRNVIGIVAPLTAGFVGEFVGILYIVYFCILLAAVGTYRSHLLVPDVVVKKVESKNQ